MDNASKLNEQILQEVIHKAKLDTACTTFARQVLQTNEDLEPSNKTLEELLEDKATFAQWFANNTDVEPNTANAKFGLNTLHTIKYDFIPFSVSYEVEREVFFGEFMDFQNNPVFFFAENINYDNGDFEAYIYFNLPLDDPFGNIEEIRQQLTEKVSIVNLNSIIQDISEGEQEYYDDRISAAENAGEYERNTY